MLCSEPAVAAQAFGAWVTTECLLPPAWDGPAAAERLTGMSACRGDIARESAVPSADDATWVVCACGAALAAEMGGSWFDGLRLTALVALVVLGLLVLALCCACRDAKRARKQRKAAEFELETLKAAEKEATTAGRTPIELREL